MHFLQLMSVLLGVFLLHEYTSGMSPHRAMILLNKYGYLQLPSKEYLNSPRYRNAIVQDGNYTKALKKLQRFFGLPETGILSKNVRKLLISKRCGNPDITNNDPFVIKIKARNSTVNGTLKRFKRYFIDDPRMKWLKTDLTWKIVKYPSKGLSQLEVRAAFTKAFNMWSREVNLNFQEAGGSEQADIIILFGSRYHGDNIKFDGPGGVLAHAFYPIGTQDPPYSRGGDAHFDDDEKWITYGSNGRYLLSVAVHELGHSMGLGHSASENAIMYPLYNHPNEELKLSNDDIRGMKKIYGPATPGKYLPRVPDVPAPKYTPPPITTPKPDTRKTIDFCNTIVDAVIIIREVELYVFKGNLQWRIDFSKTVTSWISYEYRDGPETIKYYWPVLPKSIKYIDGGLERLDQKIYIFSGSRFWLLENNEILSQWVPREGLTLDKLGLPKSLKKIDAIFRWSYNRGVYIMAGTKYWRINEKKFKFGYKYPRYPREIHSVWKNVPLPVDMAYTGLHGNTYFVKGNMYYPFNNLEMKVTSSGKPLKVPWIGCMDSKNP